MNCELHQLTVRVDVFVFKLMLFPCRSSYQNFSTLFDLCSNCTTKTKRQHNLQKPLTLSSDPSGQSGSPSQRHLFVMQKLSEHLKSVSGGQVVGGHPCSSLISPQSSSPSQRQRFCMQRPFPQVNSSERQVSSRSYRMEGRKKKTTNFN